jgi:hypothetical protein
MAKIIHHPGVGFMSLIMSLFLISSCTVTRQYIINNLETIPQYPINPSPELILLINTHDIPAENIRDKKQELFLALADSVLAELSRQIGSRSDIVSKIVFGVTKTAIPGDVRPIMTEHAASHCIAITNFDVFFDQTEVVVTGEGDYKNKEAYYDIISRISYSLYTTLAPVVEMPVRASRYHSSRSVTSGLLAAGPNIVTNREDALNVSRDNVELFLNNFLPGQTERNRIIFVGKELSKVNDAFLNRDYETALKESLLYVNAADKKLAAKANLNCAVLLEHNQLSPVAKSYLEKSLQLYTLPEALTMKSDYGLQ